MIYDARLLKKEFNLFSLYRAVSLKTSHVLTSPFASFPRCQLCFLIFFKVTDWKLEWCDLALGKSDQVLFSAFTLFMDLLIPPKATVIIPHSASFSCPSCNVHCRILKIVKTISILSAAAAVDEQWTPLSDGDKIGGSHEGMLENVQPLHMKWIQIEMFNLSIQMDPKIQILSLEFI